MPVPVPTEADVPVVVAGVGAGVFVGMCSRCMLVVMRDSPVMARSHMHAVEWCQ